MKDCTFCKIYASKQKVIFENELFYAQFDSFPVTSGHAEVIPKKHITSLFDLTQEEWTNLKPAIYEVVKIIEGTNFKELYQKYLDEPLNDKSVEFCKKMLDHVGIHKKPDAYNIGINEGEAAGRTVHHLHTHIIPRHFGDVEDYIGGIRHI